MHKPELVDLIPLYFKFIRKFKRDNQIRIDQLRCICYIYHHHKQGNEVTAAMFSAFLFRFANFSNTKRLRKELPEVGLVILTVVPRSQGKDKIVYTLSAKGLGIMQDLDNKLQAGFRNEPLWCPGPKPRKR